MLANAVPLEKTFYERPTEVVAAALIGVLLVLEDPEHGTLAGRIVETEAYLDQHDRASHAAPGPTARNRVMFGESGRSYVYFIYGMYHCLNVVARANRAAGAILIRAVEPLVGLETMEKRRPAAKRWQDLASGPGRLTRAFGISPSHHDLSFAEPPLRLLETVATARNPVMASPRIGIQHCADWPLRFFEKDNPCVSRSVLNRTAHLLHGVPWSPDGAPIVRP